MLSTFGLFAAAMSAVSPVPPPVPMIGVLEQSQCVEDASLALRPLFALGDGGWVAIDEGSAAAKALQPMEWSVALDGKTVGVVRTAAFDEATAPVLDIVDSKTAPPTGNAQLRFEGWCGTPARRPLAASSTGRTADPDRWKPYRPDAAQVGALFATFASTAGKAQTCNGEELVDQAYDVNQVRVVGAYRDSSGRKVIGLALDASLNTCDGPPDDAWLPHWFSVSADIAFIGRELDLVEAADFDGNGKSELLFWFSGYNNDGYVLLDDTLKHRSEVLWSYH